MGRPCSCRCGGEACACKTLTLFEWSGDRDFAGDLDIRNYPGFRSSILNSQKSGTSLLWRIRYNPNQAFTEWLTDNKILNGGSFGFNNQEYFPFASETAYFSGPLRDGIIYGLDSVPAGRDLLHPGDPYADPVNYFFTGTADLYHYNTNGSAFPASWTVEQWPANPVAMPWVLELGCARCSALDAVSWPDHTRWFYSPAVSFNPFTPGGIGSAAIDPAASTLISETVSGTCQVITDDDLESVFWPGDEAEPDHAATCPPDCLVWISDMRLISNPSFTGGGGARSIPGKSFPIDSPEHPATALAAAGGYVSQLEGWTGRIGGDDVARAARGDSADIGNVDCIWLVNPYYIYDFLQGSLVSFNMASGDVQWVRDWLALGGKTLIIDAPWNHVQGTSSNPTGSQQPNIVLANDFLGWIGSSLSLYAIEDHLSGGTYPFRVIAEVDCVATQQHALVPVPHTLFSAVQWPAGSSLLTAIPFGGGNIDPTATGISGGTALYQYDCVVRTITAPLQTPGSTFDTNETHPVIAVDELANGSRIITGAISVSYVNHAELRQGLSSIAGIGDLIARIVQSA